LETRDMDIERMTVKEFREFGFLQELNRQFLHPLGLALEVIIDEEDGSERFGEVWDYRCDPEGIRFAEFSVDEMERGLRIKELQEEKGKTRRSHLGYIIQPFVEVQPLVEGEGKHRCEPGYDFDEERQVFPSAGFGAAIIACYEDEEGKLWAVNSEYCIQVNFCPFCGYAAREQVEWKPS